MPPATPEPAAGPRPAGFWQRSAAWSLDAALLALPAWWLAAPARRHGLHAFDQVADILAAATADAMRQVADGAPPLQAALALAADPAFARATALLHAALFDLLATPLLAFVALAFAWHVGFEASAWRGSPGKRALGLRVQDAHGRPLGLAGAALRFVAGTASWLSLNLGHAMAAIPPRHLALHDRLSGTRVLARTGVLPAWAKAWLVLQALALLAGCAWLAASLQAALQAALDGSLGV